MKATIAPEFEVTEEQFELAAQAVATQAPDLAPLTWERFSGPSWLLIPDDQGRLSKSELTLVRSAASTVKLNIWYRPDLRGDGRPMPHNHPWASFASTVLPGGYREDRYWLNDFHRVQADFKVEHRSPATNVVNHNLFHEVIEVDPGTISLMVCGQGQRGNWWHLDIDSASAIQTQPVADFDAKFAALNPHLRRSA